MASTNNFLPTRAKQVKKTKTTKEVLGIEGAKNRVVVMTPLQEVLTPTSSRRKRKISPKSNATTVIGKGITLINIFRIRKRSLKTSINFGDLHVSDCK